MAVATPASPAEFLDLVARSGIVSPDRLAAAVPDPSALPPQVQKVAALLIQKGLLTKFQATQLLQGRFKGFKVGPYLLREQIGRGGMGLVYLAEHAELRRKVALKVLIVSKDDNGKLAQERFLREGRSAAALDHPNIVRIFDVGRHENVPFLVMEYVDGETLQETIDRDGPMPYAEAAECVAQAAAGLQHAHEMGFVHRDIKPANVMRDRHGAIKILDMGLARNASDADNLTARLDHGAVVGTADFIAPEQALSNHVVDVRADIYSLGATFFALVSGKPPFQGNTAQKLLQHQLKEAPRLCDLDDALPDGLAAVAAKMLAKKPEHRFQTPAEVIAALAPWVGDSTRVLAGLSRTNAQASLSGLVSLSGTGQVPTLKDGPASGVVSPDIAKQDTLPVSASETTRSPVPARPVSAPTPVPVDDEPAAAEPAGGKKKLVLLAAAGFVVAAAGAVVGWFAFAGPTKPGPQPVPEAPPDVAKDLTPAPTPEPVRPRTPVVVPKPEVAVTPKPEPKAPPKAVAATSNERVVFALNLDGLRPFTVRSGLTVRPDGQKPAKVISTTGATPPAGWVGRCYNAETEMEFFAEEYPGSGPVLGIRNAKGPGSAMLFTPKFDAPSGAVRVKLDYQAAVKDRAFVIRFKPPTGAAWDVTRSAPVGPGWRTEELVVDLKGATGGFFEFHNTDPDPKAALRVRGLVVSDCPSGKVADLTTWKEGAVVYRLDVNAIAPFRNVKEGGKRTSGDPERLPPGVSCSCWKAGAVGEFRCEDGEGLNALGVTNLNDQKSGQFVFDLEKGLKLGLTPGVAYRVKVVYAARNEAAGALHVQTQDYKGVAKADLKPTAGAWKPAAVSFLRKDGVPVRVALDNNAVGEGNTLLIRAFELVELIEP